MQSHMWLGGPAGHLGTVEEHEVQMVSYNKPLSSTSSFLSSSYCFPILLTLQFPPTSSLPAFLAAIFNADQATSWRHSSPPLWLFIPSNHAFVPFPLRLLLLIVIRGSWVFILYDGVKRVSWAALPIEEQDANCGQSLSIIPPIRLCVCVCALVLDQRRLRGLSVCIFCANNFWLILNYGWCWTPCRHKGMFTPTKTVWGSRWRLSQSIPSQSYFATVWMCPNCAQTICRASWMCYLAETSFPFFSSYFFLFFSAGKWWCSSGQCSQVSSSYTLLLCPSVSMYL